MKIKRSSNPDKDDLTPKCRAVLDLLNSLVEQFKYLMEEAPTTQTTKGKSRPCSKAIDKVKESLQMFDDIVTNVVIPSAEKKQSLSNLKNEIKLTLDEVHQKGKIFINKATVFSTDPLGEKIILFKYSRISK